MGFYKVDYEILDHFYIEEIKKLNSLRGGGRF